MENKLRILVLGLFTLAAFTTLAFANEESCCKSMEKGMEKGKMSLHEMFFHKAEMIKEHAAKLGLSDEQLLKIATLKTDVKKAMIKNEADIELLIIDFEALLAKDEIDVAAANSLIDKKYALKTQEAKMLVSSLADLKKVLTKDQMTKLHELWGSEKMEGSKGMMEKKMMKR